MSVQSLELTPREVDVWNTFRTCLHLDNMKIFSSDDLYGYGLQRYMRDPSHEVGSFFRKLQHQGLIQHVGYTHSKRQSNNHREVKVWRIK